MIRLSKRMSELDICSRREADKYMERQEVFVRGIPAVLGQKVDPTETDITISSPHYDESDLYDAVVLHKPRGFVSSQPEEGKVPAVRLLTPKQRMTHLEQELQQRHDDDDNDGDGDDQPLPELHYRRIRRSNGTQETTLAGYAPAGRLDQDSSGLLVFCRSGILAKKLVSADGLIEKEYLVQVEYAKRPMQTERKLGLQSLPPPTLDLSIINRGGAYLAGEGPSDTLEPKPLKPAYAEWIRKGSILRIILKEGRKRQIRRMVRELLGYHVVRLHRTRIGPIHIGKLPSRKWRQLSRQEVDTIMSTPTSK